MFRKGWMAVVVAVAALAVVGCGGGGDDDSAAASKDASQTTEQAPQTKQQWIKQVSAACAELHEEREAEIKGFQQKSKDRGEEESGLAVALEEVIMPSMREQLATLEAIEAPKAEQAKVDAIWAAYARGLAKLEDVVASESGFTGQNPFQAYMTKAAAYGLHDCEP